MLSMTKPRVFANSELLPHWFIVGAFLLLLLGYNVVCQVWPGQIRLNIDAADRVVYRSVFYSIAIILFPLVKLLRYILLRLNQTMPGPSSARRRYFYSIAVCLLLIELVGAFGFLMFVLGDGVNTLYIFSGLAALGLFLHIPNRAEYVSIQHALANKKSLSVE